MTFWATFVMLILARGLLTYAVFLSWGIGPAGFAALYMLFLEPYLTPEPGSTE